jgi:hypothetical protein
MASTRSRDTLVINDAATGTGTISVKHVTLFNSPARKCARIVTLGVSATIGAEVDTAFAPAIVMCSVEGVIMDTEL